VTGQSPVASAPPSPLNPSPAGPSSPAGRSSVEDPSSPSGEPSGRQLKSDVHSQRDPLDVEVQEQPPASQSGKQRTGLDKRQGAFAAVNVEQMSNASPEPSSEVLASSVLPLSSPPHPLPATATVIAGTTSKEVRRSP
jgi:hypothetical protein